MILVEDIFFKLKLNLIKIMSRKISILFCINILFSQVDTTITIDASDYNNWTYFSLRTAEIVYPQDPLSSNDWDIAFQRKHIKTNSGLSGDGIGGASVDSTITWIDEWNNIDSNIINHEWIEDSILNDFYDLTTHTFGPGIKNEALNSWGWFDDEYQLNVTHYVFHVLTADGENIVKFWPFSYYNNNGQGGYVSFRYAADFELNSSCNYILGDVTMDQVINVTDIISIVNNILNLINYNDCQLQIADINQDGFINVTDVIALVNIIID